MFYICRFNNELKIIFKKLYLGSSPAWTTERDSVSKQQTKQKTNPKQKLHLYWTYANFSPCYLSPGQQSIKLTHKTHCISYRNTEQPRFLVSVRGYWGQSLKDTEGWLRICRSAQGIQKWRRAICSPIQNSIKYENKYLTLLQKDHATKSQRNTMIKVWPVYH